MGSLTAPRYELKLLDESGNMSREWYKFLVNLSKAIGSSGTLADDLQTTQQIELADMAGLIAQFTQRRDDFMLFEKPDTGKPVDNTLLALWPGSAI